jgi:hypothetical protein
VTTATAPAVANHPGRVQFEGGYYRAYLAGRLIATRLTNTDAHAAILDAWNRTPPTAMHAVLAFIGAHVRRTIADGGIIAQRGYVEPTEVTGTQVTGHFRCVVRTGAVSIVSTSEAA